MFTTLVLFKCSMYPSGRDPPPHGLSVWSGRPDCGAAAAGGQPQPADPQAPVRGLPCPGPPEPPAHGHRQQPPGRGLRHPRAERSVLPRGVKRWKSLALKKVDLFIFIFLFIKVALKGGCMLHHQVVCRVRIALDLSVGAWVLLTVRLLSTAPLQPTPFTPPTTSRSSPTSASRTPWTKRCWV